MITIIMKIKNSDNYNVYNNYSLYNTYNRPSYNNSDIIK